MATKDRVVVFYDGACSLCSREMEFYKKKPLAQGSGIEFVDFRTADLTQYSHTGMDVKSLQKKLHVLEGTHMFVGVDGFLKIWHTLKLWPFAQRLGHIKVLRPFWHISYAAFARFVRPYFSRHKCQSNICKR